MKRYFFFSFIFISLVFHSTAQLKLALPFGNHMVLQRNKPIPIWGWAAKNEKVTIQFHQSIIQTQADQSGKWIIQLPAMKEGGPYELIVKNKQQSILVNDIMLGEVWLCSGQSNMEFVMRDAFHLNAAIATVKQSDIRQFTVPNEVNLQPVDSIKGGEWVKADAESLVNFTAVGYSFAKELAQKLQVTVGLIKDAWGGSQIEGWISKKAMSESDVLQNYAAHFPETWEQADAILLKNLQDKLAASDHQIPSTDLNVLLHEDTTVFDHWLPYAPPSQWDWQGIWAFRGAGFMERTITINSNEFSKPSILSLGENDGLFQLYINGKLVKEATGKNARIIQLPAYTWKEGRNIILLHQEKQIDPVWFGNGFYGEPNSLYLKFDAAPITLAGNGWKMIPDFKMPWYYNHAQNNAGAIIYNAMIHPLIPYAMQGVLWYQGESNAERAFEYRKSFPLLIESWRSAWKEEFPFYFVQLSSFGKFQNSNQGSAWAELREAQNLALKLPKTGMAVTMDIGNPDNVHPRNKEDVGKRLAANALLKTYRLPIDVYTGPSFESVKFNSNEAVLSFSNLGTGWLVKDPYGYIKGFEIAGADHKFYYAQAKIVDNKILVSSTKVIEPKAVRYAWSDAPVDANLFNLEGFPAAAFRTDDWPGITKEARFK